MNRIPSITDSDEFRYPSVDMDRIKAVEDHTDNMLDDCKTFEGAAKLVIEHDLDAGDFLPKLMEAIASWSGSSETANKRMWLLHNLLADELQKIAERETK